MAEHAAACLAWDAALARILQADDRRRLAWNNFANLVGRLDSAPRRDKGKGRASSPLFIRDDLELDVAGFADSGEADDDDDKDDDDEDNDEGEGEDEAVGGDGAMDVS